MKITRSIYDGVAINFIEYSPSEYETKLISVPHAANRKSVETFCKENNAEVAVNGGLFDYSPTYAVVGTAHYINGIYSSNANLVMTGSDKKPVIMCTKDGGMWADVFSNIARINNLSWAREVAYYCCVYEGKVGCFSLGEELNADVLVDNYSQKHKRTMIGVKFNGNIVIACSEEKITGLQEGKYMKNVRGCKFAFNLDGGGSTHMYDGINKKYIVQGDRTVTDAIVVIKKPKPLPPAQPTSGCMMKLTGSAARLRKDVVNGQTNIIIPNGTTFKVVGLYSWKASDNFRWGWGEYNGYSGYFQYDPAVMNPVGNVENLNYKMILIGSAARLRKTIRGEVITTVPNGNTIQILEFIDGKQSDGYQWCKGSFNGTIGYFQYDPAVMFPTND